jgi:hypothetical protein
MKRQKNRRHLAKFCEMIFTSSLGRNRELQISSALLLISPHHKDIFHGTFIFNGPIQGAMPILPTWARWKNLKTNDSNTVTG